jgi:hypothetical protein
MKAFFSFLFLLAAVPAQAHPSLVPHHHPHGVSMLPDLDMLVVGFIFLLAVAMVIYTKFTRG